MKRQIKLLLITGGVLNTLMAFFHIYLGYQISKIFGSLDAYPLMQMLNIGGCLMIFFFAYTSLFLADELTASRAGRSIIVLNILLYAARIAGEFILFARPRPVIIGVCVILAGIYITVLFLSRYRALSLKNV